MATVRTLFKSAGVSSIVAAGFGYFWVSNREVALTEENVTRPKYRVGVLGSTGTVGQRFIQQLEDHPWFEVVALGASSRSAGNAYNEVVKWKQITKIPTGAGNVEVTECIPSAFGECDFVFSALDASVAGEIEKSFVDAGFPVFSNARNYRRGSDVPLIVPQVNSSHLPLITRQPSFSHNGGFIVTNANCSTTGLVIALKPLHEKFGIRAVSVVTMQAISGAGYPGVPSLDILDNLIPRIGGEEDKLEWEYQKILGSLRDKPSATTGKGEWEWIQPASFPVSAAANRVAVSDGHTLCVSVELESDASPEEVVAAFQSYQPPAALLELPSAPSQYIEVRQQPDRPQPKLDRNAGDGYTTVIGRVRPCPINTVKFVVVSHNTVMGAAGSSILNAEFAAKCGLLPKKSTRE